MSDDFLSDFLERRGITPGGEVARERGYAPYEAGDVDAVYEAAGSVMEKDGGGRRNPGWVEKFTGSAGWVIPKHRVFDHLPHIRPQLRPDVAVVEKVWEHDHVPGKAVDSEGGVMSGHALEQHVRSKNRADEHAAVRRRHKRHRHIEKAKYGIAPEEDMTLPDGGRWLYDDSKRLDHNPISDFSLPGPVFFGIEGTPKNDAMVEWLREHGRPPKVVNVPSVSTWRAPELALFAIRHMRGHPVVIVPDADWITNDEVIYHAENCALYLRHRCGVDAVVAAPPAGFGREPDDKGVDDWLGPNYNGSLDGLHVIRREFDPAALGDFEDEYRSVARARGARGKTVDTDLHVARTAGRTSGRQGTTLRNVRALAPLARGSSVITEEEALAISVPDHWPHWSNPVARLYAHMRREHDNYTAAQEHETYRALERLEGIAFEATGTWPDWVEPRWETVGRKKDGTPRRARKKGSPGSRIEFVRMDERLRTHELDPMPLGEHLAPRF